MKLQGSGAFSLYQNSEVGNSLFMLSHPSINYRKVLQSPRNFSFDEWPGLWRLVEHHGLPASNHLCMAEILVGRHDLRLHWGQNFFPQLFLWRDGRLLRRYWTGGEREDEFAYIHLQKRRFEPLGIADTAGGIAFTPGRFVPLRAEADLYALALHNRPSRWKDLAFAFGRPGRYLRSRRRFDRSLM